MGVSLAPQGEKGVGVLVQNPNCLNRKESTEQESGWVRKSKEKREMLASVGHGGPHRMFKAR